MQRTITTAIITAALLLPTIALADPAGPTPDWVDADEVAAAKAEAAPAAVDPEDPVGLAQHLVAAVRSGAYLVAFGALLLLAVFVVRKLLLRRVDWFQTKLGGYAVNVGSAVGLTLGLAWSGGEPPSLTLIVGAFTAALVAAGGWEAARDAIPWLRSERDG